MQHGIRGWVAQGMDGRRRKPVVEVLRADLISSGSGSITVPEHCTAYVWAIGAGGSGRTSGSNGAGGGGGGALYYECLVFSGQTISYVIGTGGAAVGTANADGFPGTDTTVTMPGNRVLRAGGGGAGTTTGGAGGIASGGLRNYQGGAGGNPNAAGEAGGNGGGAGGAAGSGLGGGGGAANPGDIPAGTLAMSVGAGGPADNSGTNYGSGSGGVNGLVGKVGRDGQILILLVKRSA